MKKFLIYSMASFLMLAMVSLSGCKKDDPPPTPPPTPTFELRFTCTSNNPYLIEVNGNSDIVDGNSYITYTFNKGTYSWKVTQQSGYVFSPTIKDGTVNLDQDIEIVFP